MCSSDLLVTPPLQAGLLPGTLRGRLLRRGRLREGSVVVETLQRADGVWLINSVRGWVRAELAGPAA